MAKHILFCRQCKKYTMKSMCSCGAKTVSVRPARYSPVDKWGKYRRMAKSLNN